MPRLPVGIVLTDPETATLFRGMMEEVDAVARASDVPLLRDCVDRWWGT